MSCHHDRFPKEEQLVIIVLLYQWGHAQIYKHLSYRSKAITEPYIKCIVEVDILPP
jgi:hypothetical protein